MRGYLVDGRIIAATNDNPPDRSAALKQLIPGTEDYYYFHALHYQNTRQVKELGESIERQKDYQYYYRYYRKRRP